MTLKSENDEKSDKNVFFITFVTFYVILTSGIWGCLIFTPLLEVSFPSKT